MKTWVLYVLIAHFNSGTSVDSRHVYDDELRCIRAAKVLQDAVEQTPADPLVFRGVVRAVCVEGP